MRTRTAREFFSLPVCCMSFMRDSNLQTCAVPGVGINCKLPPYGAHPFFNHSWPLPAALQLRIGEVSGKRKAAAIIIHPQFPAAVSGLEPNQHILRTAVFANIDQCLAQDQY